MSWENILKDSDKFQGPTRFKTTEQVIDAYNEIFLKIGEETKALFRFLGKEIQDLEEYISDGNKAYFRKQTKKIMDEVRNYKSVVEEQQNYGHGTTSRMYIDPADEPRMGKIGPDDYPGLEESD